MPSFSWHSSTWTWIISTFGWSGLQNWLYGYIGARFQVVLWKAKKKLFSFFLLLSFSLLQNNALAFNPVLPPEMEQVTVRAFHYLDCTLTLAFNATLLDVHLDAGSSMYVVSGGGKHWTLLSHMGQQTVSLPPGQFYLTKTKARVARG
eukprot:m.227698 g.227698  ORF g.227698 m.227698 type:complete len:148 (+) comp22373_c0_seq9:909-1352(+)